MHITSISLVALLALASCGGKQQASPTAATPEQQEPEAPNESPAPQPQLPKSIAGQCPAGQTFFAPGCGESPIPEKACYTTCTDDSACTDGQQCQEATYHPCTDSPCRACGSSTKVCLPAK